MHTERPIYRRHRAVSTLVGATLLLAPGVALTSCVLPQSLIVDSTLDAHDQAIDGVCDDGAGHCTIRAALEEAAAVIGTDAEVTVPPGSYALTLGQIDVSGDNVIAVNLGMTGIVAIDLSGNADRFLSIGADAAVDLTGFHITGGTTPGDGGAAVVSGRLALRRTTLSSNAAGGDGGAVAVVAGGRLELEAATIADNAALGSGDQIDNGGFVFGWHATIAGAVSGTIHTQGAAVTNIMRSVVAGGAPACTGSSPSSGGHNVVSDASCAAAPSDVTADPQLGPLTDGVRIPASSSPAADLIPVGFDLPTLAICNATMTDQLGRPRPHGASCDAGAVETNAAPECPTTWTHLIAGEAAGTLGCVDADGDAVGDYQLFSNDTSGTVTIDPLTGAFTVTGALSGETFTYTAGDGSLTSPAATLSVQTSAPADMFLPPDNRNCAAYCFDVGMGDLDGDGDLDIVASAQGGSVIVYRSDDGALPGNPGDFPGEYYATGANPLWLDLGDVDADGDLDLAVVMYDDQTVWVYRNDGTGHFTSHAVVATGAAVGVHLGDADGDGDDDVFAPRPANADVSYAPSNGDGTFGARVDLPLASPANGIDLGDVNGDGDLDIVAVVAADGSYAVLLGDGDGGFATPTIAPGLAGPTHLHLGDLDGDGDLDIVGVGNSNTVLLGNGDGTFGTAAPLFAAGVARVDQRGVLTDLDGDGTLDLTLAGYDSSSLAVHLGNGDGTFAPPTDVGGGWHNFRVAAGDFDGDGKVDLVTANNNGQAIGLKLQS